AKNTPNLKKSGGETLEESEEETSLAYAFISGDLSSPLFPVCSPGLLSDVVVVQVFFFSGSSGRFPAPLVVDIALAQNDGAKTGNLRTKKWQNRTRLEVLKRYQNASDKILGYCLQIYINL
ncbi:hypothetical protein RhiirC2_800783, partial [Rhizophagus irregularis]